MIILLLTGLVMGGIGSLHCVGMCGPLALAVPVPGGSVQAKLLATLLYNIGRVVTYAVLGAAFGLAGFSLSLFGFQQWLSILAGAAIIVYLLYPQLSFYKKGHERFQGMMARLRSALATLFKKKNYRSVFFIGLLNGLLPCGLVYMAIATSVATGSVGKSSFFMAAFGLGTLPLMWTASFFGHMISFKARTTIRKAYPYILFIMACFLIIRGMGLSIPYLSPQLHPGNGGPGNVIECHL